MISRVYRALLATDFLPKVRTPQVAALGIHGRVARDGAGKLNAQQFNVLLPVLKHGLRSLACAQAIGGITVSEIKVKDVTTLCACQSC